MTNEERISKWRQFKQLVAMNPKRYRMRIYKIGRNGFAFGVEEYIFSYTHSGSLFQPDLNHSRLVVGPSYGYSRRPLWDWTIISHSDAWFAPTSSNAVHKVG